jgi:hypothetical protein
MIQNKLESNSFGALIYYGQTPLFGSSNVQKVLKKSLLNID